MKHKFLTSPTACNLYKIEIKDDEVRSGSDWTSFLIIKDEEKANELMDEIHSTLEKFKDKYKWIGDKEYFGCQRKAA